MTIAAAIAPSITEPEKGPQRAQGALWPYVDKQFVPDLPTGWIRAWEKNPRKHFEDAALCELADSIRADGVQQPIVVRLVGVAPSDDARFGSHPLLEIVMGERRYLASIRAGRPSLPAIIRVGMDDRTALRLAVTENLKRRDLNAIEEADSYRALLDEGYSQDEVAAQIGVDKSTVSNALRLRKLPDVIQAMVRDGQLSASHARALLRFEGFPEVQEAIAEMAMEQGVPAKALEKGVPFAGKLADKHLLLHVYSTRFDKTTHCEVCPHNAYRQSDTNDGRYCLKPDHFHELTNAAEAERQEKMEQAKAELERRQQEQRAAMQALAAQQSRTQEESHVTKTETQQRPLTTDECFAAFNGALASAERSGGETAGDEASVSPGAVSDEPSQEGGAPLLSRGDLRYGEYEEIWDTAPDVCREKCSACVCKTAVRGYNGAVEYVCLDPKRMRSLKIQVSRSKTQERKNKFGDYAEKLFALQFTDADDDKFTRALALLLWTHFDKLSLAVVARLLPEITGTPLANFLQKARYQRNDRACYDALLALSPAQMVSLAVRATLEQEMVSALQNKSDSIPDTEWFFGDRTSETLRSLHVNAASAPSELDDSAAEEESGEEDEEETVPSICTQCFNLIPMDQLGSPAQSVNVLTDLVLIGTDNFEEPAWHVGQKVEVCYIPDLPDPAWEAATIARLTNDAIYIVDESCPEEYSIYAPQGKPVRIGLPPAQVSEEKCDVTV